MTRRLPFPITRNYHLAIGSFASGLLSVLISLFSSFELLMSLIFQLRHFLELANGRSWDLVPKIHIPIFLGIFILGIIAIVTGIISLVKIKKGIITNSKGLAIAGIILGPIGALPILALLVFNFIVMMMIIG
jgi:hypothetical protein